MPKKHCEKYCKLFRQFGCLGGRDEWDCYRIWKSRVLKGWVDEPEYSARIREITETLGV